ncbi:hypothetical protein MRB53_000049 [Persea americana]|uniref:Uncharacterized protein n=1 Tax=Persea americana TaxID=3435 RepID=A0ACC2MMZ6_PERAE|nr:hypothetical protein MRB53_000049 [Persea americana]|eukprot:TRINITY_DN48149_c0_g1_i1.p1 TRINITY_DN48149_c0_g1~~TRINITY_DN48149_c0_g1_i1.p1  ORF type:complete len:112 (+),score=6.55 TRINITY_DN48149_c0_g1_i1:96-431(+)
MTIKTTEEESKPAAGSNEIVETQGESTDEIEAFKTAGKSDDWRCPFVHHQVLKIREEESHLGEDIGEGLSAKDKVSSAFLHLRSHMDALFNSRPMLPSSPLGNKSVFRSLQ